MSSDKQFNGKWHDKITQISVNLSMIIFEEDNAHIVYCPALDLTGYGNTEDEAKASFEIALDEFFKYTINKGTLMKEFSRLGWKAKNKGKKMIPPSMQDLLSENDNFNRIFNNHDFRKFSREIRLPKVA